MADLRKTISDVVFADLGGKVNSEVLGHLVVHLVDAINEKHDVRSKGRPETDAEWIERINREATQI